MMRNLSSVDSYMLFLLVYKIIIFVMISGIGGSGKMDKLSYTSLAYQTHNDIKDGYMMRKLSSVDSCMLFLLVYEIIMFVMISATCSKM